MFDSRISRLKIMSADERIFELRREMDATETKLETLRRELVAALENRVEAMRELHSEEVYF